MGGAGHREKGFSSAGVGIVLSLSNSGLSRVMGEDDGVARREMYC